LIADRFAARFFPFLLSRVLERSAAEAAGGRIQKIVVNPDTPRKKGEVVWPARERKNAAVTSAKRFGSFNEPAETPPPFRNSVGVCQTFVRKCNRRSLAHRLRSWRRMSPKRFRFRRRKPSGVVVETPGKSAGRARLSIRDCASCRHWRDVADDSVGSACPRAFSSPARQAAG